MMPRYIFLMLVIYFLSGCGSQKVITTRYYVIEIDRENLEQGPENQQPSISEYCEIKQVEVYPTYASAQIANRSDEKEIIYYEHHQWAIRPAEAFTRIVQDYYDHVPVFKGTSTRFWKIEPAYHIETTVYHLEVIQQDDSFTAHLDVEFVLRETGEGTPVLKHHADKTENLPVKDINLLATSMGEIFYHELKIFSDKITEELGGGR